MARFDLVVDSVLVIGYMKMPRILISAGTGM